MILHLQIDFSLSFSDSLDFHFPQRLLSTLLSNYHFVPIPEPEPSVPPPSFLSSNNGTGLGDLAMEVEKQEEEADKEKEEKERERRKKWFGKVIWSMGEQV